MSDQNQDTLFQSGTFDSNYEVNDIDPGFEPHYNTINQQGEIQIYEMIMGDVNNDVTTVLERANHSLKDNRIPPEGFVSTHPSYDTMRIVGDAENDPDFNKSNSIEGTGRDVVHYHIPFNGATGIFSIYAKVYYQSVPPKWLQEMFTFNSAAIDTFRNMYLASDRNPILCASDQLLNIAVTDVSNAVLKQSIRILNTLNNGSVFIENKNGCVVYSVKAFSADGQEISNVSINSHAPLIRVQLPHGKGVYLLEIETDKGRMVVKVVMI